MAAGNLKQPTKQHVINWVTKAWEELPEDILKRSFLKCGMSNELDGSQDNTIQADIPVNICGDNLDQGDCLEEDDIDELDPFSDEEDMD